MRYIFIIGVLLTLISCKKEHATITVNQIASPAQLAKVVDSIQGSWSLVSSQAIGSSITGLGLPDPTNYPITGSVIFSNAILLNTVDYQLNKAKYSYSLSGINNTYYLSINQSPSVIRKCKILKLTADSLLLQNVLTGIDTNSKITFTQHYSRATASEVTLKQFKITFNSLKGGVFTVKVYITHLNGLETLVATQNNTINYTYLYVPNIGDHIRASIDSPGSGSFVNSLAFYEGLPYGQGWQYTSVSLNYSQNWDIKQ